MLRHHISGFTIPIQVLDKKHAVQNTIATAALWTDLPAESSYPSSDELISLLQAHQGQMTIDELPEVLSRLAQHTLSENLGLVLDFPYFIDIQTDSGERRFAQHVSFSVRRDQAAQVDFILNTSFPVALNREAISLSISLKSSAFYWIEEIIALGDDAASQLISAETPLRDFVNHLTTSLQNLPSLEWVKVRITHNETPTTPIKLAGAGLKRNQRPSLYLSHERHRLLEPGYVVSEEHEGSISKGLQPYLSALALF